MQYLRRQPFELRKLLPKLRHRYVIKQRLQHFHWNVSMGFPGAPTRPVIS
jgi:hypothetical protein